MTFQGMEQCLGFCKITSLSSPVRVPASAAASRSVTPAKVRTWSCLTSMAKRVGKRAADTRGGGGRAPHSTLAATARGPCRATAEKVASEVGQFSILVNNAGINRRNAFTADADAVLKDWQDIMAINLNGVF